MFLLADLKIISKKEQLTTIPAGKQLINCINAHSYNTAQKDIVFAKLFNDKRFYIIPDGVGIIYACKLLNIKNRPTKRIVGWDLFITEMEALKEKCLSNKSDLKPVVMFMGSTEKNLSMIKARVAKEYPMFDVVTYSPPFTKEFSKEENTLMANAINNANPDLLWIGMTAPKQEKWAYSHWDELNIHCHVGTIGAVFDFYSGNVKRAPLWFQNHGLEWFYRFCQEPRRLWKRYILGNMLFIYNIMKEKYSSRQLSDD